MPPMPPTVAPAMGAHHQQGDRPAQNSLAGGVSPASSSEDDGSHTQHCVGTNQVVGLRSVAATVTNIARRDLFHMVKFYKATKSKKDARLEVMIKDYLQREMKDTFGKEEWLALKITITKSLRTRRCTSVEALKKLVMGEQDLTTSVTKLASSLAFSQ